MESDTNSYRSEFVPVSCNYPLSHNSIKITTYTELNDGQNIEIMKTCLWYIIYSNFGVKNWMKDDHRSQKRNFGVAKTKPEKIQPCSGFEPLTSMIPVECSTNWAKKPTRIRLSKWFVVKPSWCVYNCDDLLSFISSPSSSYILVSYINRHPFTGLWRTNSMTWTQLACWLNR